MLAVDKGLSLWLSDHIISKLGYVFCTGTYLETFLEKGSKKYYKNDL